MEVVDQRRRRFTAAQRQEVWTRWHAGATVDAIAAALAASVSGVYGEITAHGGIAPGVRHRSARTLTLGERACLARWRVGQRDGLSVRAAVGACALDGQSRDSTQWRAHGDHPTL